MADFKNSHRMTWFCLIAIVGLTGLGLFLGTDGMGQAVGAACVALAGLAGAYSGVSNWRETKD
jgi:hypothetical protein